MQTSEVKIDSNHSVMFIDPGTGVHKKSTALSNFLIESISAASVTIKFESQFKYDFLCVISLKRLRRKYSQL